MADTDVMMNGAPPVARELPEVVVIGAAEMQQFPSPGTQRTLKAQTGRDYMALVGPDADSADRTQTQVWVHLRKQFPDLDWHECDEVALQLGDGVSGLDPSALASFASSPPSADSGE